MLFAMTAVWVRSFSVRQLLASAMVVGSLVLNFAFAWDESSLRLHSRPFTYLDSPINCCRLSELFSISRSPWIAGLLLRQIVGSPLYSLDGPYQIRNHQKTRPLAGVQFSHSSSASDRGLPFRQTGVRSPHHGRSDWDLLAMVHQCRFAWSAACRPPGSRGSRQLFSLIRES
jgi:hypothetical protein